MRIVTALRRLVHKLYRAGRRVVIWVVAASITLAILFITVVVYQLTVYEPDPPPQARCAAQDLLRAEDGALEVHLYWCERGDSKPWKGFEIWLYEPLINDWQRMITMPASSCPSINFAREQRLLVKHNGSRGNLQVAETAFLFDDVDGLAQTLAIETERRSTSSTCQGVVNKS